MCVLSEGQMNHRIVECSFGSRIFIYSLNTVKTVQIEKVIKKKINNNRTTSVLLLSLSVLYFLSKAVRMCAFL